MEKHLFFKFILMTMISALLLTFSGGSFAEEPAKPAAEKGKTADGEYKANINQIAFIVKFDKDGNGKVDNKEFTGRHFSNMDKNGDGFIEPHEAPEGETAY